MKQVLEILINVFFTVGIVGTSISLLLFVVSIVSNKRYLKSIVKSFSVSMIIVWFIYVVSAMLLLFS